VNRPSLRAAVPVVGRARDVLGEVGAAEVGPLLAQSNKSLGPVEQFPAVEAALGDPLVSPSLRRQSIQLTWLIAGSPDTDS
jgi:hypothetical protein